MIMMRSGLVGTPRCGASALHSSGMRVHVGRLLGRHRIGRHAFLGVVPGGPGGGGDGVGQVGLVQDLQAGALAELAQLLDHRVAARLGKAGIQDLDDHVRVFHLLRGRLAGSGHVAREPLNRHAYSQ
jgi:hypothetical protein